MLSAGKLRHRVQIQSPAFTQDTATGALNESWQTIATVWAEIAPLSAKEFVASQAEASKVATRITVRYNAAITAKCRVYHPAKGLYYNIEGVLSDKESGLEYQTLPCSEGIRYIAGEAAAPANLSLPSITGLAKVGEIVTTSTGAWANDPAAYSYQWHRGDSEVITGATNSTYLLTEAEADIDVYCTVTATNAAGGASVNTADIGPIAP